MAGIYDNSFSLDNLDTFNIFQGNTPDVVRSSNIGKIQFGSIDDNFGTPFGVAGTDINRVKVGRVTINPGEYIDNIFFVEEF